MSDRKFERFGKYLILDHLVDGGMAKICRARFLGEQANKIVAIKMVQAQFSRDPSFVRMFQDELSVTFGLQHPNIAQTYDYGKVNEQLYTAMEYVDGANLKQFLDRLKEKNYVFPVEISVYIVSQICQGLHYAHTFQDKLTGKPLHIVHRDISPHNVMLTYDGAVKVIDFGIAKSNANSEATQAGTIKGKLSYLAPEYLEGMELDHRYDQFAVGITLWEMLCSRKLFTAANDLAVLKQIQACKVTPPSQINPNVSKELDAIVMKALSKDRNLRYEDMDKFNRALVKFLYAQYPDFNPSDLSYFAKELFKEEIKRDKEKFVEYGKIDVVPYLEAIKYDESLGSANAAAAPAQAPQSAGPIEKGQELKRIERIEIDLGEVDKKSVSNIELNRVSVQAAKTGNTRKILRSTLSQGSAQPVQAAKANIADAGLELESKTAMTKIAKVEKTGANTRSTAARTKVTKAAAQVEETEQPISKREVGPGAVAGVIVASFLALAYLQGDLVEGLVGFNLHKMVHGEEVAVTVVNPENNGEAAREPAARETETPGEQGRISLGGVDLEMEVYINGAKQSYGLGIPLKAPLEKPLTVSVRKAGFDSFTKTVTLTTAKSSIFIDVPELVKSRVGILSSSLNYPAGSVLEFQVHGEKTRMTMPFKDQRIPAGTYEAKVINPNLGSEKKINFTVEENKIQLLE